MTPVHGTVTLTMRESTVGNRGRKLGADRSESGASFDLLDVAHHCTSVAEDPPAKFRRHTECSDEDDPRSTSGSDSRRT